MSLQLNGLYVILILRTSPPQRIDFIWGFYLHGNSSRGTRYHIKNMGSGWITEHEQVAGAIDTFSLIGFVQIATIPTGQESYVDEQIRAYDSSLNSLSELSSRTWVLRVIALLQKEVNGAKLVKCADLNALDGEIKSFGNEHALATHNNKKPRPIIISSIFS